MLAIVLFNFGWVLLAPADTFSTSKVYTGLETWFNEATWGWICFWIGLSRLTALTINGAWRPTYHIRTGFAVFGAVFFAILSGCFASSGVLGVWACIWPVTILFEIWNALRAAEDAAKADKYAWTRKRAGSLRSAR